MKFFRLPAPPSRDRRHQQLFPEQVAAETWKKSEKGRAFHQPGAKGVGDSDVARASRFDETSHSQKRISAQLQRIAKRIVHAPKNHIDALKAFDRLEENPPVSHRPV